MFEYVFGFLVGAATMYVIYQLKFKKMANKTGNLDQSSDNIEAKQSLIRLGEIKI